MRVRESNNIDEKLLYTSIKMDMSIVLREKPGNFIPLRVI